MGCRRLWTTAVIYCHVMYPVDIDDDDIVVVRWQTEVNGRTVNIDPFGICEWVGL